MFQILDEMSELVYVADLETYDLLYINQAGREMFGIADNAVGKCYRTLQGRESPCEFCTNARLSENAFYNWEKTNPMVGRHFLLKDKLIDWNGKKARVEIAFDMTEATLVTECARRLCEADENAAAVDEVLAMSGRYLQSDRVYLLEMQDGRAEKTHEWRAPGVAPRDGDLTRERGGIVVPLRLHNELIGYIGVDNESVPMRETADSFLTSVGYFISTMLRQQRTLAQLERMSYVDSLTGIRNRNAYMQALGRPFTFPVGVAYLDVNGMKEINNRLGHKNGDAVLREAAQALSEIFSGGECYRIGADEFVAICEGTGDSEFHDRVLRLKNHFAFHSEFCVSLGGSWVEAAESLREIVYRAEASMFEDKKAFYRGHVLSGRYRSQTDDILGLTSPNALREKIEAGRFEVYLQPQVDVRTQRLTGAEALVRYRDAAGAFYLPNQFIPILEEARLISELDFHVFERVCRLIGQWRAAGIGLVHISTNFSRHTLGMDGFADRLQEICKQHRIGKELLEIEITETVEADNRQLFYHAVEQLKQNRFRISIDDFGVSNANLALLSDIDFHVLKLDKHVVDNLCENKKTRLLVAALVGICHEMGIRIIAEGVETEGQFHVLQELSCDMAQGYLFGRPIPAQEFRDRFLL